MNKIYINNFHNTPIITNYPKQDNNINNIAYEKILNKDTTSFKGNKPLFNISKEDEQNLLFRVLNNTPEDIENLVKKDPSLKLLHKDFFNLNQNMGKAYNSFNNIQDNFTEFANPKLEKLKEIDVVPISSRIPIIGAPIVIAEKIRDIGAGILADRNHFPPYNIRKHSSEIENLSEGIRTKYQLNALNPIHEGYIKKTNSIIEVVPKLELIIKKHQENEQKTYDFLYSKDDSNAYMVMHTIDQVYEKYASSLNRRTLIKLLTL